MPIAAYTCTNPACDEGDGSTTSTQGSKCQLMEKCVSSCSAYGRVCPCAARAAGRAACRAIERLYAADSKVFKEKPNYEHFDAGDLLIQEKLGEGGFSLVHHVTLKAGKAQDKDLAVKYLKRKIMVDQHSFELGAADLAVEAHFLATLNHKNIVTLFGVTAGSVETNVASGRECGFFIIIDLLKETLDKKIEIWKETADQGNLLSRMSNEFKEKRKLALMDRLKVAIELADAMIYLHSKAIVYRDLKPDNIGFDVNGTLKLFDFGLAKELKGSHTDGFYKLTGNTGSRRYMAPEVAKVHHYNLLVDVYSFAILLHEMASLEKPFQGYTASKHMAQVVMGGERPRLDTASTSWFPYELQWLFRKCWSASPTERPAFESVKRSLEDIVDTSAKSTGKFGRPRQTTSGDRCDPLANTKQPTSSLPTGTRTPNGSDTPPDFSKMKPAAKPTRQVKSLGFLRKN